MRPVVLDASVALKIFLPVPGNAQARAAARLFAFVAPPLVLVETANAFRKYVRRGDTTAEDGEASIRNLAGLITVNPDSLVFGNALSLAATLDHPVYDCVYLALAQRDRLPILSADKRLLALARDRLGIEAIDLADIPAEEEE